MYNVYRNLLCFHYTTQNCWFVFLLFFSSLQQSCKQSSKNHSSHLFHHDHHHFGRFFRISHICMFLLCFHSTHFSFMFNCECWQLNRSTFNSFQLLVCFPLLLSLFVCGVAVPLNDSKFGYTMVTWLQLQLVQTANNNGSDSL